MSDPRWPDDRPDWPEHDLRQPEGEESSGTDAPPSGDESEPVSDPSAPEDSPAERPWDEPRWEAPRRDDSPWDEPRWGEARREDAPEEPRPEEPRSDESPPQHEGHESAEDEPRPWERRSVDWTASEQAASSSEQPGQYQQASEGQRWEQQPQEQEGSWEQQPQEEEPSPDEPEEPSWLAAPGEQQGGSEDVGDQLLGEELPAGQPLSEPEAGEPEPGQWAPERGETEPAADADVLGGGPALASGQPTTAFGAGDDTDWDPRLHGERRRPTTAEQAVPWMIGVILALAGIVIVLLALIFTFPGGLTGAASPTPTVSPEPSLPVASGTVDGSVEPSPTADTSTPTPEPTQGPTPTPVPEYGALEMIYLGRPSALAPIYLLNRDFSVNEDATVLAQANQGVSRFAWSPDGRVGAAIITGRAVGLTPGASARALAEGVSALTFGWDSATVYGVRITRDGANDRTEILEIDFVSAATKTLATITYPHPVTAPDPALREAQFIDNGGLVRIYTLADGNLGLWVLGAPAVYRIDPGDGRVSNLSRQPILWAPDGTRRITLSENANGTSVIELRDQTGATATVQVTGLVSHVRWAGSNNEIVFTLGRLGSSGGVRQDLYVWDLTDGKAPLPLTSNGISFGAEWRGAAPNWMP